MRLKLNAGALPCRLFLQHCLRVAVNVGFEYYYYKYIYCQLCFGYDSYVLKYQRSSYTMKLYGMEHSLYTKYISKRLNKIFSSNLII